MTTEIKSSFEHHVEIMNEYTLHPDLIPKNQSMLWGVKFDGIEGGIKDGPAKGAFQLYNCSFEFNRTKNGSGQTSLNGSTVFILQNTPDSPIFCVLFQNLCADHVFKTTSFVRLGDSDGEKYIQNAILTTNARVFKIRENNDFICIELLFDTAKVIDYPVDDLNELSGKFESGYNFEVGKSIT